MCCFLIIRYCILHNVLYIYIYWLFNKWRRYLKFELAQLINSWWMTQLGMVINSGDLIRSALHWKTSACIVTSLEIAWFWSGFHTLWYLKSLCPWSRSVLRSFRSVYFCLLQLYTYFGLSDHSFTTDKGIIHANSNWWIRFEACPL